MAKPENEWINNIDIKDENEWIDCIELDPIEDEWIDVIDHLGEPSTDTQTSDTFEEPVEGISRIM